MAALVFVVGSRLRATGLPFHFPLFVLAICRNRAHLAPAGGADGLSRGTSVRMAWLLLGLDVVLVTAIVTTSGGAAVPLHFSSTSSR